MLATERCDAQAFDPRVKADGASSPIIVFALAALSLCFTAGVLKTIQKIAPGQEGLDVPGFNKSPTNSSLPRICTPLWPHAPHDLAHQWPAP